MSTITKPYGDFTNNVDVADANKVNSQINTLYNAVNGQLDLSNLSTGSYSTSATASTLVERDANGAINVTRVNGFQTITLPNFWIG